jgi:hypothetical protein
VDKVAGSGACPTVKDPIGGDAAGRDYTAYITVKTAFDALNYDLATLTGAHGYVFNPYNALIHSPPPPPPSNPLYGLNIPCAYGYSVDDAQGNVQAEGKGFIVDVGSTINLELQSKCGPLININLGYNPPPFTPRFFKYAVCSTTSPPPNTRPYDRVKPIIPGFSSFVINAKNPANCPIFIWDTTGDANQFGPPTGTMYTFKINADPNNLTGAFPFFSNPANAAWSAVTSAKVGCMGNNTNPAYSSRLWCCTKNTVFPADPNAGSGIFAFSKSVLAAHSTIEYNVQAPPAQPFCSDPDTCHKETTNFNPCNVDQ